jgi:hypothetical protein
LYAFLRSAIDLSEAALVVAAADAAATFVASCAAFSAASSAFAATNCDCTEDNSVARSRIDTVLTATPTGDATTPETKKPTTGIASKSALTRPDWADDVKNDRTFKNVNFDDPETLKKIQGKTRGEVYDMLRKAQAERFMAEANEEGDKLRDKLRDKELNNQAAARAADFYTKQGQVDSKVESALSDAEKSLDSPFSDISGVDYDSFINAKEIARLITPYGGKDLLNIAVGLNAKLDEQGFASPDADYYSMTTEEKYADFQKRSAMDSSQKGSYAPYFYKIVNGEVSVERNPLYVSKEAKVLEDLNKQKDDYNSPLNTNARNQVLAEASAKKERLNELALLRETYRAQRRESLQQRSVNADMLPTIGYGKIEQ